MAIKASLNLRAGVVSACIFLSILGLWHLATTTASAPVAATSTLTAEQQEYAKMMGKDTASAKSAGFPTLGQMGETAWGHLSNPFYDNGPNDKGIAIQIGHSLLRVGLGFGLACLVAINVASTASYQPVPGMAVYGATKAYVRSFTEALWGELQGTKVRAFAVSPGATATEFFDIAGASPAGTLAPISTVVDVVMDALTTTKPAPSKIVGGRNRVMARATQILPKKTVIKTVGKLFIPKD